MPPLTLPFSYVTVVVVAVLGIWTPIEGKARSDHYGPVQIYFCRKPGASTSTFPEDLNACIPGIGHMIIIVVHGEPNRYYKTALKKYQQQFDLPTESKIKSKTEALVVVDSGGSSGHQPPRVELFSENQLIIDISDRDFASDYVLVPKHLEDIVYDCKVSGRKNAHKFSPIPVSEARVRFGGFRKGDLIQIITPSFTSAGLDDTEFNLVTDDAIGKLLDLQKSRPTWVGPNGVADTEGSVGRSAGAVANE